MKHWKKVCTNPQSTLPTYPENALGIIAVHDATLSPTDFSSIVKGPLTTAELNLLTEIKKPLTPDELNEEWINYFDPHQPKG